jgi:hypothetical protein
MSSESSQTTYEVSINGNGLNPGLTFYADSDNWTDEFALSLAAALNSLSWPEGTAFAIGKTVADLTSYAPDYTQDPPVFS